MALPTTAIIGFVFNYNSKLHTGQSIICKQVSRNS